ncbi:hypothetical protein HN695_00725 [Candidatus Woesearchaeota archaeon]|jgi:hypothetical protein|nr:hypothetical protein [Candidatus Woesearchaeota archaeon]MBT5272803.1 hypothetical protein [Candidatus Woesearchaeota archaeon]MBT6040415.1 hypothetical protein [Candidatus Woesearchaeota archaeon]MBT6336952.1 hypothetical protein [Candidatus Woesearchaeota archaeon]MBT7926838.1 hypothetical protein [Candidatus Woesearchaeota archaeon]
MGKLDTLDVNISGAFVDLGLLMKIMQDINVIQNYSLKINTRIKTKPKKMHKSKDSGLTKKLGKVKSKKDKDIVIIIDESDKHKDDLDKDIEAITLKMDGFEKIHIEQYEKQLEQYKRFLAEYLKEAQNALTSAYDPYQDENGDGKREFEWGQEVVTYFEIKDIVRRIHMNALMSGNASGTMSGHNNVGWQEAEDYKFWKYCSKFNEQMSFIIHDVIGSGG